MRRRRRRAALGIVCSQCIGCPQFDELAKPAEYTCALCNLRIVIEYAPHALSFSLVQLAGIKVLSVARTCAYMIAINIGPGHNRGQYKTRARARSRMHAKIYFRSARKQHMQYIY